MQVVRVRDPDAARTQPRLGGWVPPHLLEPVGCCGVEVSGGLSGRGIITAVGAVLEFLGVAQAGHCEPGEHGGSSGVGG